MNQTNFKNSESKSQTLKRLWKYYSIDKFKFYFVLFIIMVGVAANIGGTYLLPKILQRVVYSVNPVPSYEIGWGLSKDASIWVGFLLVTGLFAIYSACLYIANIILVKISQNIGYQIRKDAFFKVQNVPLSFLDTKSNGDLTSRLTNDIDVTVTLLSQNSLQIFQSTISMIGVVIAIFLISPIVSLILIGSLLLLYSLVIVLVKKAQPHFKNQQIAMGQINSLSEEYISGHKVVNAFRYEDKSIEMFSEASNDLAHSSKIAENIGRAIFPYNNFISNIILAIVSLICVTFIAYEIPFYGISGNVAAQDAFSIVLTFIMFARQLTTPISTIMSIMNQVQLGIVGLSRAFEVIDSESEKDADSNEELILNSTKVEFKNIVFSYDKTNPDKKILKDVSFVAKPGTMNAIVGPTGSGKTTIISLLTRFYDLDSGKILIDGKDISKYKRSEVRKNITIVLQDSFLFSKSIRENIRYGKLDATDEEIIQAAKAANAWHFIQQLPEGLDTVIDQEKCGISEGQKQLISIARAFLSDAKIIILDEATSYVDTKTEKEIQNAMAKLMRSRTSFVIAHRLSTIKDADNIIVLKDGVKIEEGNHKKLMNKKGFYYNLSNSVSEE